MPKQHTTPCKDCPWRKVSMKGWLGSKHTPEEWTQAAHGESRIECHIHKAQCAGAAIYRANVCKAPRDPKMLVLKPDRTAVFSSPRDFITHHRSGNVVSSEIPKLKALNED